MKMTKSEVKDEQKQAEGDPVVKGQQRKKMMETMPTTAWFFSPSTPRRPKGW